MPMSEWLVVEVLTCHGCGGQWWREVKRGRKPGRCPGCRPVSRDWCEWCFQSLTRYQRRYCSHDCRGKAKADWWVCDGCGEFFQARKGRSSYCSRECAFEDGATGGAPEPSERDCDWCGESFTAVWAGYCSYECRKIHGKSWPVWYHTCDECGDLFTSRQPNAKRCSDECALIVNRRRARRRHREKRGLQAGEVECAECGEVRWFEKYAEIRRFCGPVCAQRFCQRQNRALRRGAKEGGDEVSMHYLYTRDSGRCQICGEKVDPDVVFPDPGSATVDHIIPITKGGSHTLANVQLAHHGCNSRKGNGSTGSQLRLLG